MASKKTTTRAKRQTPKKSAKTQQRHQSMRYEIKLTLAIAMFLFLLATIYSDATGIVGNWVQTVLKGLFSYYIYLFPVALFATVFIEINANLKAYRWRVHLTNALLAVAVLLTIALNSTGDMNRTIFSTKGVEQAYQNGQQFIGAGVVGELFYSLVHTPIGHWGTVLVIFTLIMLFLVITLDITPTKIGKFLGKSAVATKDTIEKTNDVIGGAIKTSVTQFREEIKQGDNQRDKKHLIDLLKNEEFSSDDTADKSSEDFIGQPKSKKTTQKQTHVVDAEGNVEMGSITILDYNAKSNELQSAQFNSADDSNTDVVLTDAQTVQSERVKKENALKNLKEIKKENANISQDEIDEVESEIDEKVKISYADYRLPNVSLLKNGVHNSSDKDRQDILDKAKLLEETLNNFKIDAKVVQVSKGPMITRFEIQPSPGVKVSKIVSLTDDIALNLAATSVRIVAPIPGKAAVGIEVPNSTTSIVTLRDVVETEQYQTDKDYIRFGLGKDISGLPIVANLSKMPHLLIAGATGSGKSVCVNTIITSILYNAKPDQVKFLMIDPKVVELNVYNGIPHLILPVVTDPKKASIALNWAVQEMSERYNKFADSGVRDINSYNQRFEADDSVEAMPRIVVIIDELADLMMVAPNQVEDAICRLAQMARAAGIHLIVATQRPSVDVITGVIKANIPSRIAFAVSSSVDSRTIIDMGGAEKLLGKGDMLYYPVGKAKPMRVQGSYISENEVERVVEFVKGQVDGELHYDDIALDDVETSLNQANSNEDVDELLADAIEFVVTSEKASTSLLQRRFRVGYNRAARMIDALEERGIIGPSRGSKPREVLITPQEYEMSGE